MSQIRSLLKERILLLDGAMGTLIQQYNLTEEDFRGNLVLAEMQYKGNNDMLVLTQPELIETIHRRYLEAGADIIETNTFSANAISMEDYQMGTFVKEINTKAVEIALKVAKEFTLANPSKPRFVAGSMGPTNKSCSISPDVNNPAFRSITFDQLAEAYEEQMIALLEAGVDLFLIETIFDTLNAKAAIFAAESAMSRCNRKIPILLSVSLTEGGRTLSGQTPAAFLTSVEHTELLSVGFNCSFGAKEMKPYLKELSECAPYYVSCFPNAGLPNQLGAYDESPKKMSSQVSEFINESLINIIGGCCGTTPEHISAFASLLSAPHTIREPNEKKNEMVLSGLDRLTVSKENNFLNVGERCNVAGSRKFLNLIKAKKYEEAAEIARKQVEDGAQVIDVNMDDGMLDAQMEMTHFINVLMSEPEIAKVPLMLDSSDISVLKEGLKYVQGKSIVNSISLKEGEASFLEKAESIKRLGAAVVVMCFDENGQADTYEKKISISERAYGLLTQRLSFNPNDIVFDPNILTIATGMEEHTNYALDFINATRWIKDHLPSARVIGGVSNLSFSFRGNNKIREAMHSVFLYHAIKEGLDMGIVNPTESLNYDDIPLDIRNAIEDVIFNRKKEATENLVAIAEAYRETADPKSIETKEEWRTSTAEARVQHALQKGISGYLTDDIHELLSSGLLPLQIIDDVLMPAMGKVGEMFGEGKLFLPQVVKSARIMKSVITILEPYLHKDDNASSSKGKVIMATVKGDVHDIGKNITGVILACNGYEVIDLGIMIPAEKIVEAVRVHNADAVGLSGLIAPSLDEMCNVAAEVKKQGISIPILIGGAATSKLHTALKISNHYDGCVIHAKDASVAPSILSKVLNVGSGRQSRDQYIKENSEIRDNYLSASASLTTEEATERKLALDWLNYTPSIPNKGGVSKIKYSINELFSLINWRMFFHAWSFPASFSEIAKLHNCEACRTQWIHSLPEKSRIMANEALNLYNDALTQLATLIEYKAEIECLIGLFKANATTDGVVIKAENELFLPTPRQNKQKESSDTSAYLSLSDFIAPTESGIDDHIGIFATTIGTVIRNFVSQYTESDNYSLLLLQTLSDRLVEAAAERIHFDARTSLWGYDPNETFSPESLLKAKYKGIRPAVGYPSMPDQKAIFILDQAVQLSEVGITLTENGAMSPGSSVCGIMIAHTEAKYFTI